MECTVCRQVPAVYKCPLNYSPTKIVVTITSLCGTVYNFKQPIAEKDLGEGIGTSSIEFEFLEGSLFCSIECCEQFINEHSRDYRFSKSLPILKQYSDLCK